MPSEPIQTIDIRGQKVDIFVESSNDNDGMVFSAYWNKDHFSAPNFTTLKKRLLAASKGLKVAVPFVYHDKYARTGNGLRRGTATGIHASSRNVLIRWANGEADQLHSYGGGDVFGGLTTADFEYYGALLEERKRIEADIRAFVSAHSIDLSKLVKTALVALGDES